MKLPGNGIIIRETAEADLRQIYVLWSEEAAVNNSLAGMTADELADCFASEYSIMLTAVRKKKVLGFTAGLINNNSAKIGWIMVSNKIRRKGIGTALYNRFHEKAAYAGCGSLSLVIPDDNIEALNFFHSRRLEVKRTFVELQKTIIGTE